MTGDLIDVIHGIVQDTNKGLKLTDLCFGTVEATAPLSITLETTMQPVPAAALILTDSVVARTVEIEVADETVTIPLSEDLQPGERVVMLRCASGQRFIVLSRAH